jgi:hypothetical protein
VTKINWRQIILEYNEDAIIFEGPELDEAIIGIGQQHGSPSVLIYDYELLIQVFAKQFAKEFTDDPYEAAVEWVDANVACLYAGPGTPIIRMTNGTE